MRDENTWLRKLVAYLSLNKEALHSAIEKRMELIAMKASVEHIRKQLAFHRAPGLQAVIGRRVELSIQAAATG